MAFSVLAPRIRKDTGTGAGPERRATKQVMSLEHKFFEKRLRELGVFSPEKKKAQGRA